LLDFGIAKVVREVAGGPRPLAVPTREGGVVGTPAYMAPEQALGKVVDVRADIYAVALVLYKSITGRGPFDHRKDDGGVLAAHVRDVPDPPSRFIQEPVPPELEAVVMKGLSKDPAQRFQTAEEMIAALDGIGQAFRKRAGWLATTAFDDGEPDPVPSLAPNSRLTRTEPIPAAAEEALPTPPPDPSSARTRRFETILFAGVVLLSTVMGAGLIAWLAAYLKGTP